MNKKEKYILESLYKIESEFAQWFIAIKDTIPEPDKGKYEDRLIEIRTKIREYELLDDK